MAKRKLRPLALILAVLVTLALLGSAGWAAPVPSQSSCTTSAQLDAKTVAAERELVKGKLMEYGLTEKQAASRVDLLTDQEVHSLAGNLDAVQSAGALGTIDTTQLLLLLILVVLIAH